MHIERHLIDAPGIDALDDVAGFDIAEQGYFAAQLRRKRMLCAANDHVGLDTTLLEGLYGVLRGLRLEFPRCTQVWYQGQMDGHAILLREFPLELPDGFDEWLGFHIAHGTADLSENHVILARTAQQQHSPLDFVSDVRDDLHGLAQILYKGRGSQNYDSSDTLFIRYQGGVVSILEIDQAKNPFALVGIGELVRYYDFKSEPAEFLGERMYYVVSFNQKPIMEEIYMRGKVFIDSESLAIGRVEMWMNVEGREEAADIFVLKRPQNTRFEVKSAEYVVNYKLYDGKWYYDYAKMELKFETRRKRALFKNSYSVMSEIAITDHKPAPVPIEKDARVKFRDQMTEKVSAFTDDNFWENYNVIEPDADIEAVIRKIVRQLKKHNLE